MTSEEFFGCDQVGGGLAALSLAGGEEELSGRDEKDVMVNRGALGVDGVARLEESGEERIQGLHSSNWR